MVCSNTILLCENCLHLQVATQVRDGQAVLLAVSIGGGKPTSSRWFHPPWSDPGDENYLFILEGSEGHCVSMHTTIRKIGAGEEGFFWNPTLAYQLKAICILNQAYEDTIKPFPQSQTAV
ncbi:hypothetical protein [Methanospirillum lacunae]|uniref:Uncharacterized protein n=1 Tax=Methanospirillum lacunae TaxID=668570 RepID=A0A2V2MYK6_9EURY|nr:hypothetical protein [Methanospirillum lacunae]PWR73214.1 hypothetical protein DK846_05140 [Methanospirillum lacunae]